MVNNGKITPPISIDDVKVGREGKKTGKQL